jgi:hypothetical protein
MRHKINPRAGLLEKPGQKACFRLPNPFNHSQIPGRMQSGNDFPVDLDPPIPELGIRPPIPVFRMRPGDLQQCAPQSGMSLFITSSLLRIGPSPFGKSQSRQDPVQPVFVLERPCQLNFFPRGELPAKKFFSSAISTSLWPINRSSSSIRFRTPGWSSAGKNSPALSR